METMRATLRGRQVWPKGRGGNLYWLHTNHLGNSSRMTDQNGTMVYRGEFDPYGNLVYEWGLAGLNTRKFTGYERDSNTGLDYANARMYGPGGDVMSRSCGVRGRTGITPPVSTGTVCHNDPVNSIDLQELPNPVQRSISKFYVGIPVAEAGVGSSISYPEYGLVILC